MKKLFQVINVSSVKVKLNIKLKDYNKDYRSKKNMYKFFTGGKYLSVPLYIKPNDAWNETNISQLSFFGFKQALKFQQN